MADERKNKISGSALKGYSLCNGKYNLELQCPEQPSGPAAEMGVRIHSALESGDLSTLSDEEREIAEACLAEYTEILGALNLGEPKSITKEKRLWYRDLYSGAIDQINHYGENQEIALMIDWKTGRIAQGAAHENIQLRAYAVLLKANLPHLTKVYVAIVQPMATQYTIAEYDVADLALAEEEIVGICEAAYDPEAKRTPSQGACKYCRAKSICPEARGVHTELATRRIDVPAMTNQALGDFLEKADIVEALIESVRAEAKARLIAGQEIEGRTLQKGRTTRSVTAVDAWSRLSKNASIDLMQFLDTCKVSIPSLEKALVKSLDCKAKEAKEILDEKLSEVIETKQGDPIMVRSTK
jgi:CRISPR/Cas system-associated exonuclease Cas4 (RecB family)